MESSRHRQQMSLLIEGLHLELAARPDVYVGGNMGLYFSALQAKHNDFRAPDVFVVIGADQRERKSWVVWEEGGKAPDVIVELLSDRTADVDRGEKKRIYARVLRVPVYVLFDPYTLELIVYRLENGDYVEVPPRPNGRVPVEGMELELGVHVSTYEKVEGPWLRWYRADGSLVPTRAEALEAAESLAAAERRRAEGAEAEIAQLKARLAALERGS